MKQKKIHISLPPYDFASEFWFKISKEILISKFRSKHLNYLILILWEIMHNFTKIKATQN
ncbi:hypothetical protein [Candidatus Chrysopegis kryptomonas]|uniref:hypothetical protein n=1 Tax=Candidatus Chryseopegocella kryptomonas TaxID=1633643 RepID=UPI000B8A53B0|nr:hypothetical protein [Candidatus Chrysopegis kryptomonas]